MTLELDDARLLADLSLDEGKRPRYYTDSRGNRTVGIGRNLDANPLAEDEIALLYRNDVAKAMTSLDKAVPWWRDLPLPQQRVMVNLCFNMGWGNGVRGLSGFPRFLAAMQKGEFVAAGHELKNSAWYGQVGNRGPRMIDRLLETEQ